MGSKDEKRTGMTMQAPFKWRHFEAEIILLCIRWYLRYSLSYRDLEEIMLERGLHIDHTTIYRWVQRYAPELEKRCRPHLKTTTDSWRVDETYIKVKKQWVSLYRAVDAQGNTIDFWLSSTRDGEAAKRFLLKTLTWSSRARSQGDVCLGAVSSSSSSRLVRPGIDGPHGVVRPDTSEQFHLHAQTLYSAGRLFSGTLLFRVYSFSCGVVRRPSGA